MNFLRKTGIFTLSVLLLASGHLIPQSAGQQAAISVLVWEGDGGGTDYSGTFISNYLVSQGLTVDYQSGSFPGTLTGYDAIFLSFGNSGPDGSGKTDFTNSQASLVSDYLEQGGHVYLEGGDALGSDQPSNTKLLGLMGLLSVADGGTHSVSQLTGQSGSIASSINFSGSSQTQTDFIDRYTPLGGLKAYTEDGYGTVAGQYTGVNNQRTFAFSYALAELTDGSGNDTRADLLDALITFFELDVTEPNINLSFSSLNIALPPNGITTRNLRITNTGGGTLIWNIAGQETLAVSLGLDAPVNFAGNPLRGQLVNPLPIVREGYSPIRGEHPPYASPPPGKTIANSPLPVNSMGGISLVIDDGSRENGIGLTDGGQFIWLNQFSPRSGEFPFTLEEVQVLFGSGVGISTGELVDIFIYEDPDGDISNGASLVGSLTDAAVQAVDDVTFSTYAISPITLSGPGDVIIAVVNRTAGLDIYDLPAALDQGNFAGRSWIGTYSGNPGSAPSLPATELWGTTGNFGFPGNWMIRGIGLQGTTCTWLSEAPFSGQIGGSSFADVTVTIDATGLDLGDYSCELVMASNDPDTPEITIPVNLTVANNPPQIDAIADQTMDEDQTLQVAVSSTDPEGDTIALSVKNMPEFGSFTDNGDGSGQFTFSPDFLDAATYAGIKVIATDNGTPVASDSTSFSLTIGDVNRAPVVAAINDTAVTENDTLSLAVTASDPDSDNGLTLTAGNLPAFASFADNGGGSGTLQFSPGFDQSGSYPGITIKATDDAGASLSDSVLFTLTVNNQNRAPTVAAVENQALSENQSAVVNLSASDPDGDGLFFSGLNLPTFAALSDNGNGTATLTLSPGFDDSGSYTGVSIVVTDNGTGASEQVGALSDTTTFSIDISDVNRPPVIASVSDQQVDENAALNVAISSSDADGDGLTYAALSLPAFAALSDSGNGGASIAFTPAFSDSGEHTISVIVSDNGSPALSDTLSFLLSVTDVNRAPDLLTVANQSVDENAVLAVSLSASDADGNGISYTAANLPGFATLTDSGNGGASIVFAPGFDDSGGYANITIIVTDDHGSPLSDSTSFSLTVDNVNRAPVAAAVSGQSVAENAALDVSLSASDPDGNTLQFAALAVPSFGAITDNGDGSASLRFTPGFDDDGSYAIQVEVHDSGSPQLSDTIAFQLTVSETNRMPALSATADRVMSENETLDISLTASDPDGNGLTLSGNFPGFGSLTDNGDGSGILQLTPGFNDEGSYNIIITATDDGSPALAVSDTFALTVSNVNRSPALSAITNPSASEGQVLVLNLSASDADGDGMSFSAAQLPAFALLSDSGNGSASVTFSPGFEDSGTYSNITITVTDDDASPLSDSQSFTLTVSNTNRAPALTAIADVSMTENEILNVPVSATDPDGNAVSLSALTLPAFGSFNDNGGGNGNLRLTPGPTDAGSYLMQFIARDNGVPQLSDTLAFTVTVNDTNRVPVFDPLPNVSVSEGDTLDVAITTSDPDGDNLTLATTVLPAFGSFIYAGGPTATLRFLPGADDQGNYTVSLSATDDGSPAQTTPASFTLSVGNVNRAPGIEPIGSQSVAEGDSIFLSISASDPDGNGITLAAQNLPAFAAFADLGGGSGSLTFSPGFDDAATYSNITITATDDGTPALTDSASFALTVANTNRAPAIAAIGNTSMSENQSLSVSVSASDPDGNGITLTAQNLPAFATFSDSGNGGGLITFQPGFDDSGSYPGIIVIATDNGSPVLADSSTFDLTVSNRNRAPVIAAVGNASLSENQSLSVSVTASDPDGNGITLTALNLPAFATFSDSGNGGGLITFQPGFDDSGSYPGITVIATDDGSPVLADSSTFDLTIGNVNRTPAITPVGNQGMAEDETLSLNVTASDPDGNGITLTALNLPGFADFSDAGNGSATLVLQPGFDASGDYPGIVIIATDDGLPVLADSTTFDLVVANTNRAPDLSPLANQSMDEGDTLVVPVSASDPDGNGITLVAQNLPAFATFTATGSSGTFRFTPTFGDEGSYANIRLIATDDGSPVLHDSLAFVLSVGNINRPPVITPAASQTIGEGETLRLALASSDPDGNALTLTALNLPDFAAFSQNADSAIIVFTPDFTDNGSYPGITVIATDDGTPVLADSTTFTLTVNDINRAPLITTVGNQGMAENDTLSLSISASDPDSDTLTFTALNLPDFADFSDAGDGSATLVLRPGFDDTGDYPGITIIATDDGSTVLSDSTTFDLVVANVNRSPVITVVADALMDEGDTLVVPVSASDPDGQPMSFTVVNLPAFATFTTSGDSGTFRFTPTFGDEGNYPDIRVIVSDGGTPNLADSSVFLMTVGNINRPPVITPATSQTIGEGETLRLALASNDPDGNALALTALNLPDFAAFSQSADSAIVVFTPDFTDNGSYPGITVIATDDGTPVLADSTTFTLTVNDINRAPLITTVGNQGMAENDTLSLSISASDPDSDTLTFTALNLPDFASFNDAGNGSATLVLRPGFDDTGDYPGITIIATDDGSTVLSDSTTFDLVVANVNRSPVITVVADALMDEGDTLVVPVSASDPDGQPMSFTVVNLPAFATFTTSGDSGTFRFTPTFGDEGNYPDIRVIVSDGGTPNLADSSVFLMTVGDINRPPSLAAVSNQNMPEGDTLRLVISASDPDGNALTLTALNLPDFAAFSQNADSAFIVFTPDFTTAGSYPGITVIATDDGTPVLADSTTFTLAVSDANQPPVIMAIGNQQAAEGDTLRLDILASDPENNAIILTVQNLPPFAAFANLGNGRGLLIIRPGFGDKGMYPGIKLKATDTGIPNRTTTEVFDLDVTNTNRRPVISALGNQAMAELDSLTLNLTASDPDLDSLIYSGINLPPFTVLTDFGNGTAQVRFTPDYSHGGTYPDITIAVSDTGSAALRDSTQFILTVSNINRLPSAIDDSIATVEDSAMVLHPLINDSDPDLDSLHIIAVTSASSGAVQILSGDTTLRYLPVADFSGTDQFQYIISDIWGGLDTAEVRVTVLPVNDLPVIVGLPDSLTFDAADADTLNIWDAVSDIETGDPDLTYAFFSEPDTLQLTYDAGAGLLRISAKNPVFSTQANLIVTVSDAHGGTISDTVAVTVVGALGIEDTYTGIPTSFMVFQNYPNPFNPVTKIRFGLPVAGRVRIDIYNLLGQRVATLLNAHKVAGYHTVNFEGSGYASGLYIYVVHTERQRAVHKMILLK